MKTAKVRVKRAFFYNGKPTKIDEIVEVPAVFAAELAAASKAELITEAPAKGAEPESPKGKGGKDAG